MFATQKIIPQQKETRLSKSLKLAVKIAVTAACLWYISTKIDFAAAAKTLKSANLLYLAAGAILYFISKIAASIRLNIYFKNIKILLPQVINFKLYLLGLFYNLFLPGSIGGDAYKVLLLKRRINAPYKKTTIAVLLDRFTGLLGLGLILCIYSFLVFENKNYAFALITGEVAAITISFFAFKKWFAEFLDGFWTTFFWGLVVQLFSNTSAYMIIYSLGISSHLNEYMFIFLVASVAAVLPLTLGGLGAREVVFYQFSGYFYLDTHSSVLIGLLFYFTVVIISTTGIIYIFKDPLHYLKKINEFQPSKAKNTE